MQNNSAGTIAFNGASKSLSTGSANAVTLANNGAATISFGGGGLAISTTTGAGFTASGGGTVNVTGAGNTPKREYLFAEVADDYRAYGVGNTHRHLKEMTATLGTLGADADLVFTPHLLPVARGILSTITVPLRATLDDPLAIYRDAYASEAFIELTEQQPTLHDVVQRNVVRIAATMIQGTRTPTLLVTSAIDNLVKGAAGQALQNANLMLGLDETIGLPA